MGSIKMLFGLAVIIGGVYVGGKVLPAYYENYQFQDAIKNEATLDTYSTKSENDIRLAVFRKAQDLEIPVAEEGIKVQRQGAQGSGLIIIRVPYVVHIDLPGYPLDLHFDATTENKGVF
jgi:hypothetical protein